MENTKRGWDSVPKPNKVQTVAAKKRKDTYCWICHKIGKVFPCRVCSRVYHLRCSSLTETPTRSWVCGECRNVHLSKISMRAAQTDLDRLLLCAMKRMRGIDDVSYFEKPMDLDVCPDYPDKIVKPMDLALLELNIVMKVYKTPEAFLADVKYLLHNCEICNPEQSINAEALVYIATDECAEINNCPTCYFNFRSMVKSDRFVEPCENPHVLVWAKMCGYPYWPSKLIKLEEPDKVFVTFFGDHKSYVVHVSMIYLYSQETPSKLKKTNKALNLAIQECERHIKKLIATYGPFQYAHIKTVVKLEDLKEHLKFQLPEMNKYKAHVKPSLTLPEYKRIGAMRKDSDDSQPDQEEQVDEDNMNSDGKRQDSKRMINFDDFQPGQEEQVHQDYKNGVPKRRVSKRTANFDYCHSDREKQVHKNYDNSKPKRRFSRRMENFDDSQPDNKNTQVKRRVSMRTANVVDQKKQFEDTFTNNTNSEPKKHIVRRSQPDEEEQDQDNKISLPKRRAFMRNVNLNDSQTNQQKQFNKGNKDFETKRLVAKRMANSHDIQSELNKRVFKRTANVNDFQSSQGIHDKECAYDNTNAVSKKYVMERRVIVDDLQPIQEKQVDVISEPKSSIVEVMVVVNDSDKEDERVHEKQQMDEDENSDPQGYVSKTRAVVDHSQPNQEELVVPGCSTDETNPEPNRPVPKRTTNVQDAPNQEKQVDEECATDDTNSGANRLVFSRSTNVNSHIYLEKQVEPCVNTKGMSGPVRRVFKRTANPDYSQRNQEKEFKSCITVYTNSESKRRDFQRVTIDYSQPSLDKQVDDCIAHITNSEAKRRVDRTANGPISLLDHKKPVAGCSTDNSEPNRPVSKSTANVHDSQPNQDDNENSEPKRRAPKRPTNDVKPQPGSSNFPRPISPIISVSPLPQTPSDITPDITPLKPFVEQALGIAPSEPFRFPGPPSEFAVLSGGSRCRERMALAQNSQTQQTGYKASVPDSPQEPSCRRTHQVRNESVLGDHFETLLKKLSNEITDGGQAKIFQDSIKSLEISFQKELDRIVKLKVEEMDLVHEMDKRQLVEATRRECEDEMENILKGIKKKYWCKRCFKEANFHCCDTNYYCSAKCQRYDWSAHFRSCRQRMAVQYRNVHHRNTQVANAEPSHAIIFNDPRVPSPRDRRTRTSANSLVLNSKSSATRDKVFANDSPSMSGISKLEDGHASIPADENVDTGPFTSKETTPSNYITVLNENLMPPSIPKSKRIEQKCNPMRTEEVDPLIIPAINSSNRFQAPVFSRAFASTQASVNGITKVPPARVSLDNPLIFNTLPTTRTNPVILNTVPTTKTSTMLVNSSTNQISMTSPGGEKTLYVMTTTAQQRMMDKSGQRNQIIYTLPSTSNLNFPSTVIRDISSPRLVNQPQPKPKLLLVPNSVRMPDRATSAPRAQILGRIPCFVPVSDPRTSADSRAYVMVNSNPARTPSRPVGNEVVPTPRLVTLPSGIQPQTNPLVIPSQVLPTTLNNQSTFLIFCTPQTPPFSSNSQS